MAYRKIEVAGVKYEYVIGKTHTKVKGVGVFPNENIGEMHDQLCECCGMEVRKLGLWDADELEKRPELGREIRVLPRNVAKAIEEKI